MNTWFGLNYPYDKIMTFNGKECETLLETEEYQLLDVRNRTEAARNRMTGSIHIPLNILKDKYTTLEKSKKWLVYCAGGYRSMITASFLLSKGFISIAGIEGGISQVIQYAPQLIEMDIDVEI